MATRRSIKIALFACAALLALALASSNEAIARDCVCRKIGAGVCIPDPTCSAKLNDAIERAIDEHGKAIEKAAQDAGHTADADVGIAIQKASKEIARGIVVDTMSRVTILETGYSQLQALGKEETGYGLYSYAVAVSDSSRSAAFLGQVFRSVPAIEETPAQHAQINIFYIPIKKDKAGEFADAAKLVRTATDYARLGTAYAQSFYDYRMARAILDHVCNPPAHSMHELCAGDMSRGPYIFTYAKPASSLEPVPPPFLFVDLSDVHEQAFGEIVSAFKAQVKREDFADRARIDSLRLKILEIALTAADWVSPIQKAMADIVHSDGSEEAKP